MKQLKSKLVLENPSCGNRPCIRLPVFGLRIIWHHVVKTGKSTLQAKQYYTTRPKAPMVTPWYFHKVFANEKTYSLNQSLILLLLDHILKKKTCLRHIPVALKKRIISTDFVMTDPTAFERLSLLDWHLSLAPICWHLPSYNPSLVNGWFILRQLVLVQNMVDCGRKGIAMQIQFFHQDSYIFMRSACPILSLELKGTPQCHSPPPENRTFIRPY